VRVYLRYALKETIGNLWRNRMMTIAAVLTVAVSLSLVGSALLLKQSAAQAPRSGSRATRVTIWMEPTASPNEIASVQSQLADLPIVKSCHLLHPTTGFQEAIKLLPSRSPRSHRIRGTSSFRCVPTVLRTRSSWSRFSSQPGVYSVTRARAQIREMNHAFASSRSCSSPLAGVLLLSATVLI